MLRNRQACKYLLIQFTNQQRHFHQSHGVHYSKSTPNVFRQGKIMGKLFGSRETGSKKRWFPHTDAKITASTGIVFKESQFGKTTHSCGKNATRRMTVLNKLFMKHITDLMATGEISESILGKGVQVSRLKISQDFTIVNVFWLTTGEAMKDALVEHELQRCSGLLRHELSQLGLMGVVPRIKFVKDKLFTNTTQIDMLLKNMHFDEVENSEEEPEDYTKHAKDLVKQDFFYTKATLPTNSNTKPEAKAQEFIQQNSPEKFNVPEMRHDVLGLDHKGIMIKIYTKMRKSKQAWEQHHQKGSDFTNETKEEYSASGTIKHHKTQLDQIKNKLTKSAENSDKFEAFLAKRRERKNTPERKKHRELDHLQLTAPESEEHEVILSHRQRLRYEAEDYLYEDVEDKKL